MRFAHGLLAALCLTAGCSLTPPGAPRCEGTFRPINLPAQQAMIRSMSEAEHLALCTNGSRHAEQG
jgi:hypothetical protein